MEKAVTFHLGAEPMLGILHQAVQSVDTAVLVIVGGPQYRVGSHRQFVELSRYLAAKNISSLRFDLSGMGDSYGAKNEFDQLDTQIKAAIDCLFDSIPKLRKVVLWGLCDGASASLLYAHTDPRVSAMFLLNPWLEDPAAERAVMLKHYYVKRLFSADFWRKLLGGKLNIKGSLTDAGRLVQSPQQTQPASSYQQRMLEGAERFDGKIRFVLSGRDLIAQSFATCVNRSKKWSTVMDSKCALTELKQANHTFSTADYKRQVEQLTAQFILDLCDE